MSRNTKEEKRQIRHARLRKRVAGSTERPRLVVFRSASHIYAQVVDDATGKTLVAASDLTKKKGEGPSFEGKKSDRAKQVGALVAKRCLEKGIKQVVFDRGGYQYHGRVSKVAEGAREAGLDF